MKIFVVILSIVIIGCSSSPSNEELGCQRFAALIEDVRTAFDHRGQTDYTTLEELEAQSQVMEVAELLGKRSPLLLDPLGVVARLEYMAHYNFDDTPDYKGLRRPAYSLWAAAQSVYYGSEWAPEGQLSMPIANGKLAAWKLAGACEKAGHPISGDTPWPDSPWPNAPTNILMEFVEQNCPPSPNCRGCFCDG